MKFAIFPGTFNPVHLGHLSIAQAASVQFKLGKIFFVLSPRPPHKGNNNEELIAIDDRIKILNASISSNEHFEVDLRELNRQDLSYTIDTVLEIKQEKKLSEKLGIVLGLDSFLSLESWRNSDSLAKECSFLVAPRANVAGFDLLDSLSSFHKKLEWKLIDSPLLPISSTRIRKYKQQSDERYRYMMHEDGFKIYKNI